jgi:hypothetical protein
MGEREERIHLQELAEELTGRAWVANVHRRARGPVLEVTNPDERTLNESIVCSDSDDNGLTYGILGGQTLGPVIDVGAAADRIQHVLRSVGR